MEHHICKCCGMKLNREGNYYVCDYCGNKWLIDVSNDISAVERANAWEALRQCNFERAVELFEEIIVKEEENHEGYWGRALARNGIVYVNDVVEDKKVPTCNNITESSFLKDKDVQRAISLATKDIVDSYKKQADYIERVRVEWLQKASKEPPYDIFISFKDSDRENGIERTKDSIDAQEIYTALVDAGYKVFFSRVSLRGKVSEQYEPYIYNAIKTAKVMIVFGEKPEYFNSTWIRNEWTRFRARIEKGEKHKNSLVVVVKDMNPSDLPTALKSRQAMNMADITFFETLKKHIKRVIEETNQSTHLDRIEIRGGQISKRSSQIKQQTLQTREISAAASVKTDITEVQTLSLVNTYVKAEMWKEATKLIDDVLFNNPVCAEALWKKILVKKKITNTQEFVSNIERITEEDLQDIDKILNCATENLASKVLDSLYEAKIVATDKTFYQILETILPYQYENRKAQIENSFEWAINKSQYKSFSCLLSTVESHAVDEYIGYNIRYAKVTKNPQETKECIERVFSVDEGNVEALKLVFYAQLKEKSSQEKLIESFENLLTYSENTTKTIKGVLRWFADNLKSREECVILRQILRYAEEDLSVFKEELLIIAAKMIELGYFDDAEYITKLILSFDKNNTVAYWNICLIRTKSKKSSDISKSKVLLKDIPEYTKHLALANEERRKECIALVKQQEEAKKERKREKVKKIVAMAILVVVLSLIAMPTITSEIEKAQRNGTTIKLSDDGRGYIITGYEKKTEELIIPYKILGKKVIAIAPRAFYNNRLLKVVSIPDSVTSIGDSAFYYCSSLETIIIPDSVTYIGGGTFAGCSSLTIYCEAPSKPRNWAYNWNPNDCPVVWGYKG